MENSPAAGNAEIAAKTAGVPIGLRARRICLTLGLVRLRNAHRCLSQLVLLAAIGSAAGDITLPGPPPPPQAEALAVFVRRGECAVLRLRGHSAGAAAMTFAIGDRPQHGKLSNLRLLDAWHAEVTYQSKSDDEAVADRFTYLVQTANGVSAAAEVRITIEESLPVLQVPDHLDFEPIMAGESETRQLQIRNGGGGVLVGRVTVSAPWEIPTPEFRLKSGETAMIGLIFRPDEGRNFLGIARIGRADGNEQLVKLSGVSISPILVEPATLRMTDASSSATMFLTNQIDKALQLTFALGSKFAPLQELELAPKQTRKIEIALRFPRTVPIRERITIVGPGFLVPLGVEADALSAVGAAPPPTARSVATSVIAAAPSSAPPSPAERRTALATPAAAAAPTLVAIHPRRVSADRWELRWPAAKDSVSAYQLDERILSLDLAGQLQTTWRAIRSQITRSGDSTVVQIDGLEPNELHVLRIRGLGADHSPVWEAPLISLAPTPRASQRTGIGLLFLCGALLAVVVLRRRRRRSVTDS